MHLTKMMRLSSDDWSDDLQHIVSLKAAGLAVVIVGDDAVGNFADMH